MICTGGIKLKVMRYLVAIWSNLIVLFRLISDLDSSTSLEFNCDLVNGRVSTLDRLKMSDAHDLLRRIG
jgi:hypothetical protein